jgi:uncharacterized protein (DUF362 family)
VPSCQRQFECSRRAFLRRGAVLAAGLPFLSPLTSAWAEAQKSKVALVKCPGYGAQTRPALAKCFDLLGGAAPLVKGKTVTVKINLTGTDFSPFLGRPVGETFMTHDSTVMSLLSLLFDAGATRVRLVESTQSHATLEESLTEAGWDVKALSALGKVDFENTRNLGKGKAYAHLPVKGGGAMFSAFDFNHAYADTDVMISLAKLKRHITAGVTLSMKNLFGITPNSLYGTEAGSEQATEGRATLHGEAEAKIKLPGIKDNVPYKDPFTRVPRIIVDICAARPIDIAIIDGITAMTGGEGPWTSQVAKIQVTTPGILIAGLNPVSTDAVATAVMGYPDPRAARGVHPFDYCDNHLVLAEQAGLGTADLSRIDVRGLSIAEAKYQYD